MANKYFEIVGIIILFLIGIFAEFKNWDLVGIIFFIYASVWFLLFIQKRFRDAASKKKNIFLNEEHLRKMRKIKIERRKKRKERRRRRR